VLVWLSMSSNASGWSSHYCRSWMSLSENLQFFWIERFNFLRFGKRGRLGPGENQRRTHNRPEPWRPSVHRVLAVGAPMLEWHEEVPVPELIPSRHQLGVPPELPVVVPGDNASL
jgi:hypothetical protein